MSTIWPDHVDAKFLERLRAVVAEVVAPAAAEIDKKDVYPAAIVRRLAKEGYTAVCLDEEWGGLAKPFPYMAAVFEEVGYASAATATSLITIFQSQQTIRMFGEESLKKEFLPKFRQGLLCSFAMTEAKHGSDVKRLDTKAVRDGSEWVLDGEKSFVTSSAAAELFVVLAEAPAGVTGFALTRDQAGVRPYLGASSHTFGLRNGPHLNLELKGVRLAADRKIGEEGKGVKVAATTLDHSRVAAAAIECGIARAAIDGAMGWAKDRVAFNQKVIEFQGIQWYLADLVTDIDAARLLTYEAASRLDAAGGGAGGPHGGKAPGDHDIARWGAEAKLMSSRVAFEAANKAIQICGAHGCGTDSPFGRYLRDAKTYEIAGGSSEILRNTIMKRLLVSLGRAPSAPPPSKS